MHLRILIADHVLDILCQNIHNIMELIEGLFWRLRKLTYFPVDFDEGILLNLLCETEASVIGGQCDHDPAQCRACPWLQQDVTVAQTDLKLGSKIVRIVECARVHVTFSGDSSVKCRTIPRSPERSWWVKNPGLSICRLLARSQNTGWADSSNGQKIFPLSSIRLYKLTEETDLRYILYIASLLREWCRSNWPDGEMIWLSGSSHCESTRKEVYPCLDRPVHHPLVDGSDKYERDKVSFVRARNVSCECGAKTCDSLPRQCGCWYSAEQGRVEFDSGKKGFAQKEA